ncbi:hypothetical protein IFM89_015856 [Coptis chinensis]|uniref:Glycosyltransferase n=1 Tax=Coptis chinensis TaxID=261450 RepID=A0A835IPB7_9MAGN|nr:hypothetical protein IFM89_015856 [Coptis chinensis]
MGSISDNKKPHAVCVPYPAPGHINPMLKLAKILHYKGFHITFVNTEYNHKRLVRSRGPASVEGLPDFQFKTIPDGLPPPDGDHTQDNTALSYSTSHNCFIPFKNLINELNNTPNLPPVSRIVSDGVTSFTLTVSKELGIPNVLFWTTSACGFVGYLQFRYLIDNGFTPLKDESYLTNGYLDTPVDWVPGFKDIRLKDLPSFIRTTDRDDIMLNFELGEAEKAKEGFAIILNTFDALEDDAINAVRSELPPIYTIGSLSLLVRHFSEKGLNSIGSNLWKEDSECIRWLDTKEPNSVVYVNFGSITTITPQQMTEFAWGLANSNQKFLWIIRPGLVSGDTSILPPEFVVETKERGLLASWCSQEQVLNHPSVGGFLTHSGWNSTIESICSGVPMICWPFFAEQQMNCRYCCIHWGIGMEIDSDVKREEVESAVREMLQGKKGKEMKINAVEWKKKAEKAVSLGGSSYENVDKLLNEALY